MDCSYWIRNLYGKLKDRELVSTSLEIEDAPDLDLTEFGIGSMPHVTLSREEALRIRPLKLDEFAEVAKSSDGDIIALYEGMVLTDNISYMGSFSESKKTRLSQITISLGLDVFRNSLIRNGEPYSLSSAFIDWYKNDGCKYIDANADCRFGEDFSVIEDAFSRDSEYYKIQDEYKKMGKTQVRNPHLSLSRNPEVSVNAFVDLVAKLRPRI